MLGEKRSEELRNWKRVKDEFERIIYKKEEK